MKRIVIGVLGISVLGVGLQQAVGNDKPVLSDAYFAKMDTNKDGKVSRSEFVQCGVDALKKKGKKANQSELHKKFDQYDLDGDNFITSADPDYQNPVEVLTGQILGSWSTEKTKNGPVAFVFMPNGVADLIQDGKSFNESSGSLMKYRFFHPTKKPVSVEIIADQGGDSKGYYKCIIEFLSAEQMKFKMNPGSEFTPFPAGFGDGADSGMLLLDRTALAQPEPVASSSIKAATVELRGTVSVKAKVARSSDRKKKEDEMPGQVAGILRTTTTKKIKMETHSLDMALSNIGRTRGSFQLCWYFLGHAYESERVKVYDHGSTEIALDPRKRTTHSVTGRQLEVVEQKIEKENADIDYTADPINSKWGDFSDGYVVLLKQGETVLDKKSNDNKFLADHWLKKLSEL
jgi:hypothetical protein